MDDEKLAQKVLMHHISKFDLLKAEGACNHVFKLITFLSKDRNRDLIFLDIKMPEISRTDFVAMFNNPSAIIFTTAYSQYAAEAFGQNAIDYLLKPVSPDLFSRSVQKAVRVLGNRPEAASAQKQDCNCFYVKGDKRLVKLIPKNLFIEGTGNYLCLRTASEKIMVHGTLGSIEGNLRHLGCICRVHKSFFINLNKISYPEQHVISLINRKNIPVGINYRDQVYKKLKML